MTGFPAFFTFLDKSQISESASVSQRVRHLVTVEEPDVQTGCSLGNLKAVCKGEVVVCRQRLKSDMFVVERFMMYCMYY